jgi:glycerol kinase
VSIPRSFPCKTVSPRQLTTADAPSRGVTSSSGFAPSLCESIRLGACLVSSPSSSRRVQRRHVVAHPGQTEINDQLMQFEADMVGVSVERTSVAELSAMGVAHLAGLTAGIFTLAGLGQIDRGSQGFMPGAPSAAMREGAARLGTGRRWRSQWSDRFA